MKNKLIIVILILVSCTTTLAQSSGSQASLEEFFKSSNAAKDLAQCAHPTSIYNRSTYFVNGNKVIVTVYFINGSYTVITANYNGVEDYFSSVGYTKDTDPDGIPPFLGIGLIKDILVTVFNNSGSTSCLEEFFRQSVGDMTGTQLARAALTDDWWTWNGKKCGSN